MEEKTTIVMLFSMYTSTKLVVGPDILGEILFVVTVGLMGVLAGFLFLSSEEDRLMADPNIVIALTFCRKSQMGDSMSGRDTLGSKIFLYLPTWRLVMNSNVCLAPRIMLSGTYVLTV